MAGNLLEVRAGDVRAEGERLLKYLHLPWLDYPLAYVNEQDQGFIELGKVSCSEIKCLQPSQGVREILEQYPESYRSLGDVGSDDWVNGVNQAYFGGRLEEKVGFWDLGRKAIIHLANEQSSVSQQWYALVHPDTCFQKRQQLQKIVETARQQGSRVRLSTLSLLVRES